MRVNIDGDLERDQEYSQGLAGVQVWLLTSLCEREVCWSVRNMRASRWSWPCLKVEEDCSIL